jgi:hypothetical protein
LVCRWWPRRRGGVWGVGAAAWGCVWGGGSCFRVCVRWWQLLQGVSEVVAAASGCVWGGGSCFRVCVRWWQLLQGVCVRWWQLLQGVYEVVAAASGCVWGGGSCFRVCVCVCKVVAPHTFRLFLAPTRNLTIPFFVILCLPYAFWNLNCHPKENFWKS